MSIFSIGRVFRTHVLRTSVVGRTPSHRIDKILLWSRWMKQSHSCVSWCRAREFSEIWSRFVQEPPNPRGRCAFGNVCVSGKPLYNKWRVHFMCPKTPSRQEFSPPTTTIWRKCQFKLGNSVLQTIIWRSLITFPNVWSPDQILEELRFNWLPLKSFNRKSPVINVNVCHFSKEVIHSSCYRNGGKEKI